MFIIVVHLLARLPKCEQFCFVYFVYSQTLIVAPRLLDLIVQWCERIDWATLVHLALQAANEKQTVHAADMARKYPHLNEQQLADMGFPEALQRAKAFFLNVPRKLMRPSLTLWLDRMLSYLSTGVVIGLAPQHREQALSFVQQISSGNLTALEVRATVP